ncbi:MAG: polyprenyl synthetase family protein [Deltaproteobacteria bacterium]|nr:polyprenyl synthetase family protein [Deltaproteobacteria bacterium]
MQIQDVFNRYGDDLKRVEALMDIHIRSDVDIIPEVIGHLVGSGGKRFRPLLLLASADLCGYKGEARYALSAVIEFIHTATLLHDDVVDHAQIRRGKTSANNIWGNAASVLVGDFLYSRAFKIMADAGNAAVIKLLSASTSTMAEGEVFQLVKCGDIHITEKDYFSIIEKKTAVLISAACAIGAILGGATEHKREALTRFGLRLGLAFQITDDALDYVAKDVNFGKAIGKDLEEGKITLPLIHCLKKSTAHEKNLIKEIVGKKEADADAAGLIMALMEDHGSIGYALKKAAFFIDEGKKLLSGFQNSDAKSALLATADYIMERRT